jgi:hypothetical protein
MSQNENSNALQWILGGALALIGLFVIILLVGVNSQADDNVTTSVAVSNATPTIDDIHITGTSGNPSDQYTSSTPIELQVYTGKTIYVTGQVTDTNGVGTTYENGDLQSINVEFYTSATGGFGDANCNSAPSDTADGNECYTESCTMAQIDATAASFNCPIVLSWWADATEEYGRVPSGKWAAKVIAKDDSNAADSDATETTDISTVLGISIPDTLTYDSSLSRGQSTDGSGGRDNTKMTLTQNASSSATVSVEGGRLVCDVIGEVATGNQEWSLYNVNYGDVSSTDLTDSAVATDLAITWRTSESDDESSDLWWNIGLSSNPISGTCTGTTTLIASSD